MPSRRDKRSEGCIGRNAFASTVLASARLRIATGFTAPISTAVRARRAACARSSSLPSRPRSRVTGACNARDEQKAGCRMGHAPAVLLMWAKLLTPTAPAKSRATGAAIIHRRSNEIADKLSRRSEEHTSELQSLMRISYAVFCLKKKTKTHSQNKNNQYT